jgi:hypothetical protein
MGTAYAFFFFVFTIFSQNKKKLYAPDSESYLRDFFIPKLSGKYKKGLGKAILALSVRLFLF